jgi:hypothetical protein
MNDGDDDDNNSGKMFEAVNWIYMFRIQTEIDR